MAQEGVIKFDLRHTQQSLPEHVDLSELEAWRGVLFEHELIGQDPFRYDGLGYGNISMRVSPDGAFVVTGSQTGGEPYLDASQYALVTGSEVNANRLTSVGEIKPSSESLTHALLYDLDPDVQAVVHVHSPEIWHNAAALGLTTTPESAEYGSMDLVNAIKSLWRDGKLKTPGVFVMLGHQDGVVAFGPSLRAATGIILNAHHQAIFGAPGAPGGDRRL
ncbi:Ribulose-5-phosphate 4-epimerase and related epimerase and aldolases [Hahella chejuensis KCTC 2396]|uniref:Ribulose-5-phosphate 4-epimerase and related epimerase and aldolases n=1 Tax=Hahella chejuensis (strain KCTC 2396) TaxID=349521 RepID=Q2SKT8_HAHCH|nr:class II aldolase/adducin family protein [Hahella chejuensis]ABC28736.1 Ribulose-5-phosphate 4-epimerase and related epimerase and aldolases [Hahella chejuensis KCTC 2396]